MDKRNVATLTTLLVDKYGDEAAAVARNRARVHRQIEDRDTADLWSAVAASARLCFAEPRSAPAYRGTQEATLDDVLRGSVGKRAMDADGVTAKRLRKALIRDARRRRRRP
jgi:hypothetical protein